VIIKTFALILPKELEIKETTEIDKSASLLNI
jgi:hypothetical protein